MKIRGCRVCGSKNLLKILSLGNQYLSDFVKNNKKPKAFPLNIFICKRCLLVQLDYNAPQKYLYSERYGYKSGINQTMKDELKGIVEQSLKKIKKTNKKIVAVDIGANDGTMLSFYPKSIHRVSVEPVNKLAKESKKYADEVINDFFTYESYSKHTINLKADIVSAISCFYDMEDPNKFIEDVKKIIKDDGILVIQQNYLVEMLKKNAFDNICFKPDTLILGDNKPIKDLTRKGQAIGQNGNFVSIENTIQRQYKSEIVNIKAKYLDIITATPEHPIKIVKKETLRFDCGQMKNKVNIPIREEWVEAKNIKRGDFLIVPRLESNDKDTVDLIKFNQVDSPNYRRGLKQLSLTKETAWVMGLYIAEGHVNKMVPGNIIIHFTLNKKEIGYAKRVSDVFLKLGYKTSIKAGRNNTLDVSVSCTSLAKAFVEWFGKDAKTKVIPDFLLTSSKEVKQGLLQGIFAGDGYIKENKIHLHSASKILCLQVQLLVASLGAMVGISYTKPYKSEIRGRVINSSDSWQLRGSSKRLGEIFEYPYSGKPIKHIVVNDKNILTPVKSVYKEGYKGTVNNIETSDNTYLVSNAVVHNCHEHLEYYSLLALQNLLKRHGLEVFDVELRELNGGSFRTYIALKGKRKISKNVFKMQTLEKRLKLTNKKAYKDFAKRIKENKEKVVTFIKQETKKGKKIYLYGASTRGNTLLQYFGLTPKYIPYAVERNPEKWGKIIASVGIPIISEEKARKEKPDYMLVLPWFFKSEFLKREKDYLKGGGHFIFPLPKFDVV